MLVLVLVLIVVIVVLGSDGGGGACCSGSFIFSQFIVCRWALWMFVYVHVCVVDWDVAMDIYIMWAVLIAHRGPCAVCVCTVYMSVLLFGT